MMIEHTAPGAILPRHLERSANNDRIRDLHRAVHAHRAIPGMMPADIGTGILRLIDGAVTRVEVQCWLVSAVGLVPVTRNGAWDAGEPAGAVVELASGEMVGPGAGWWENRTAWVSAQAPA